MPLKSTRYRRPSNREPTSLAITPTPIPLSSLDQLQLQSIDLRLLDTTKQSELDTIEYRYPSPPQPTLDSPQASLSSSQLELEQGQPTREVSWPASDYGRITTTDDITGLAVANDAILAVNGKAGWTSVMEEALVNELVQQVEQGKRTNSGFKKEAWTIAITQVKHTTNWVVTLEQCKNKIDTMKGRWRLFNWLKEQSRFGYNEEIGLVEASYDVQENIVKVSLKSS